MLTPARNILSRASISVRFLFAACIVMSFAAYVLGTWVVRKIETGVVQNYGSTAALYIESLVSSRALERIFHQEDAADPHGALHTVFTAGNLSERVVTYKIWDRSATILESNNKALEGRSFAPSEELLVALNGDVAASFSPLEVHAETEQAIVGLPLLEVYVPIRDPASGEVVLVVEFYERAERLVEDLQKARRDTWYVVAAIFCASGLALYGIVLSASRLIERHRADLAAQLDATSELLRLNTELRERMALAARRSSSQADRIMQRIGLDLHDGVAQHLSLLALRLEGAGLADTADGETVRRSLSNAMAELRAISRGLALPDIEKLTLSEIAARAVQDHNNAFAAEVRLVDEVKEELRAEDATKLCLYRVIQELLANAEKHAKAQNITVHLSQGPAGIEVEVADDGIGFDVEQATRLREDGGQGLIGLEDRLAPLGGALTVQSRVGAGTRARFHLPLEGKEVGKTDDTAHSGRG
ncbi:Signal transduction histidine-protein kinase/phosphatase DegS [Aliiroseovarius sp. xm-v-225]|uniref:sensor histidine kinase n=1 Tax=unclassified Aliiroseovarius TaxID=2623558 RepID=UPI001567D01E|nr:MULTISPECIES: ATP-binding protein [unclassified Aliiroseovarius]NRP43549.1 Signal transduction histidine-protein kinase/phosphatase DegS [Aliiroseovarius sp. xm-m-378]NRP64420.1 Signal transduction histidine-protein kinase/phosphatase DegS [Aliiroseovarius sp. xm-v-225]NRP91481.1 Signal transduction histidine-protein kinase/phosphatase DegS [Aliiroseovarius sp. xm-a-134]